VHAHDRVRARRQCGRHARLVGAVGAAELVDTLRALRDIQAKDDLRCDALLVTDLSDPFPPP
jgi:hypothetical protein